MAGKITKIPRSDCKHLKDISTYNHNYYLLPYEIEGNNVVYEICHEDYEYFEYFFGKSSEGAFDSDISRLFYSVDATDECFDFIILDEEWRNKSFT